MSETHTDTDRDPDLASASDAAARRMTLREAWQDLTPKEKANFKKGVAVPVIAGAAATAIFAGPGLADRVSDGIENISTPDAIIDIQEAVDDGLGFESAADKAAAQLVLEHQIDPSNVNYGSLRDVVTGVPSGTTSFDIALVDEGATYRFELLPETETTTETFPDADPLSPIDTVPSPTQGDPALSTDEQAEIAQQEADQHTTPNR